MSREWQPNSALIEQIALAVAGAATDAERYEASIKVRDLMGSKWGLRVRQNGVEKLVAKVLGAMTVDVDENLAFSGGTVSADLSLAINMALGGLTAELFDVPQVWVGGSGGGRDAALQPFASNSPWNYPMGSNAVYSSSGPIVSKMRDTSPGININGSGWSIPIFQASASDPLRTFVVVSPYGLGSGTFQIRVPSNAAPATGTDGTLVIVDPSGLISHEFFQAQKQADGSWRASTYAAGVLTGSGVGYQIGYNNNYTVNSIGGSVRAYGGSAMGGVIRAGELTNGIPHALCASGPKYNNFFDPQNYIWPATRDDYDYETSGPIRMGYWFAIPPNVNLAGLGITGKALQIGLAMQRYGLVHVDKCDNHCLYIETNAASEASDVNLSQLVTLWGLLCHVTNYSQSALGGGGTPIWTIAPEIGGGGGGGSYEDGDSTYSLTTSSVGDSESVAAVRLSDEVIAGSVPGEVAGTLTWPAALSSGSGGGTTAVTTADLLVDISPDRAFPIAASPTNRAGEVTNARLTADVLAAIPLAYIGTYDATYNPSTLGSSTGLGTHTDTYDRFERVTGPDGQSMFKLRLRAGDAPPNDSGSIGRVNVISTDRRSPYSQWLAQGGEYMIGFSMTRPENDSWTDTTYNDIIALQIVDDDAGPPAIGVHIYPGGQVNSILRSTTETLESLPEWSASGTTTVDYYVMELRLASPTAGGTPYFRLYRASGASGALELVASSSNANNYGDGLSRFWVRLGLYAWAGELQFDTLAADGLIAKFSGLWIADRSTYTTLNRESLLDHMRNI